MKHSLLFKYITLCVLSSTLFHAVLTDGSQDCLFLTLEKINEKLNHPEAKVRLDSLDELEINFKKLYDARTEAIAKNDQDRVKKINEERKNIIDAISLKVLDAGNIETHINLHSERKSSATIRIAAMDLLVELAETDEERLNTSRLLISLLTSDQGNNIHVSSHALKHLEALKYKDGDFKEVLTKLIQGKEPYLQKIALEVYESTFGAPPQHTMLNPLSSILKVFRENYLEMLHYNTSYKGPKNPTIRTKEELVGLLERAKKLQEKVIPLIENKINEDSKEGKTISFSKDKSGMERSIQMLEVLIKADQAPSPSFLEALEEIMENLTKRYLTPDQTTSEESLKKISEKAKEDSLEFLKNQNIKTKEDIEKMSPLTRNRWFNAVMGRSPLVQDVGDPKSGEPGIIQLTKAIDGVYNKIDFLFSHGFTQEEIAKLIGSGLVN